MICAICGGTGGARLARGINYVCDPAALTYICNVGDNIRLLSLTICPDIDTIIYYLSGTADYDRGWGLHAESFDFLERLRQFFPDFWFGLGDKDLATHIWRSELLRNGLSLSEVTIREAHLCGVQSRILPATDSWVETQIETVSHTRLHYEEYFIRLKCEPPVSRVRYEGIEDTRPTPGVLEAIESCGALFTRYGGHSHACGFAMPSANVEDLRLKLDAFARTRLTAADFDPTLDLDAELDLSEITPELFQALELLEPYGMGNPEPIFAARGVQLTAPPRILKDKHVKFRIRTGAESRELSAAAILATPSCHPDGAAIRREEKAAAVAEVYEGGSAQKIDNREQRIDFRNKITFDALGWHMAERMKQMPLLAGDAMDVAFTIGNNDHPEYGGLELSLRDFQVLRVR